MNAIWDAIAGFNGEVNQFIWTTVGLWLLIGTGMWLSCRTGFFQILRLGHWLRHTAGRLVRKGDTAKQGGITQLQALCTALAATLGVGNIAGVAAAIVAGGPGAVFWMWVAALLGMITGYAEKVLGIYYRRRVDGAWAGGAMYYLRDGLGKKPGCRGISRVLAALFAAFTLSASFGIGNIGQVNKIVINLEQALPIPGLSDVFLCEGISLYSLAIGLLLLVAASCVIFGGLQGIARVTERLIPLMVLLFFAGSLTVVLSNGDRVGPAIGAIFRNAFSPAAVWGGAAGLALRQVIILGFKRGIYSNEAGMGSSVLIHASAEVVEPVQQGMWGLFEVFVDTLVVCTITALVVLTGGVVDLSTGALSPGVSADGSTLVAAAFQNTFGAAGEVFVAVAILLFAFSTVLGWSQYGVKAAEYLGGKRAVTAYRVVFVVLIPGGALLTSSLIWDISDTFNGLMMLPNLIAVLALSGTVRKITQNYVDRRIRHKQIPPMLSYDPRIQARMAAQLEAEQE